MFFNNANILRIRTFVVTVIFLLAVNLASSTTFMWDKNSEPNITGYNLHYGTEAGQYSVELDVGNTNLATLDLSPGTYYVAVTAKAGNLESDYSNEVSVTISDSPPTNQPDFQLIPLASQDGAIFHHLLVFRGQSGASFFLEASDDLMKWVAIEEFTTNQTGIYNYLISETVLNQAPKQFYRVIAK